MAVVHQPTIWIMVVAAVVMHAGLKAHQRRRRWGTPVAVGASLVALVAAGFHIRQSGRSVFETRVLGVLDPYRPPPVCYDGDADRLAHTVVVPSLDTPIPDGKNVVWCASFQLAWNALKDQITKGPVRLDGAGDVAGRLNRSQVQKADLPRGSCYANAGEVAQGICEQIQRELTAQFPSITAPLLRRLSRSNFTDDQLLAFAYLNVQVDFRLPFMQNDKPFIFRDTAGAKTELPSFGIRREDGSQYDELRSQVKVLYHTLEFSEPDPDYPYMMYVDEFAVELKTASEDVSIVLACVKPESTLEATLAELQRKRREFEVEINKPDPRYPQLRPRADYAELGLNDVLLVPDMHWRITKRFHELEGACILNENADGPVVEAIQALSFRLDRTGAAVESDSSIVIRCSPRPFIFHRPFLVSLHHTGAAHPFFVMWVDNAELLTKW